MITSLSHIEFIKQLQEAYDMRTVSGVIQSIKGNYRNLIGMMVSFCGALVNKDPQLQSSEQAAAEYRNLLDSFDQIHKLIKQYNLEDYDALYEHNREMFIQAIKNRTYFQNPMYSPNEADRGGSANEWRNQVNLMKNPNNLPQAKVDHIVKGTGYLPPRSIGLDPR